MKILEVGSLIKAILTGMTIGKELNGIFPSVAPDNTKFPFAVYRRSGTELNGDKEEYYRYGTAIVEISIIGANYTQSLHIASSITDEMPDSFQNEKWDVSDIQLTNAAEDYSDDAFIQVLTYNLTIDRL